MRRRLPNTSSHALVNSIINQKMYRSMPIACAWGKSNKNKALNAYKLKLQEYGHFNLKITKSGLVSNPNYVFLGASPDGVVYDPVSSDPNGLLEIKCPYQLRDCTPQEAAQQKSFFCIIENGTSFFKKTKKNSTITTTKFKDKWRSVQGSGVILLYIQILAFQSKELNLTNFSGRICS